MKVAIRVDASIKIGTGHVMRCMTLAEALRERGVEVHFVSRAHTGNLIELIQSKGFKVSTLPKGTREQISGEPVHASWLEESWEIDAEQTQEVLGEEGCDWLIVDHYALDKNWESKLRQCCRNLMVIDDLADRDHDCDMLLDQTFGRKVADYQSRVPSSCTFLLGAKYALLRPEFARWREFSLSRRENPELKKLLIFMGGGDPENLTGRILDELSRANVLEGLETIVVMGQRAPWLDKVYEQAQNLSGDVRVLSGVDNMAELMAHSDLAIGGLGTTSWERCCLGLPTLGFVLAANQREIAEELDKVGAIKLSSIENLLSSFRLINPKDLKRMSEACSEITDGKGITRLLEKMFDLNGKKVSLVLAEERDCELFYNLQREEGVRRFFKNPNIPTWEEHKSWFLHILDKSTAYLFKVIVNNMSVGMVRLDHCDTNLPEISIIISNSCNGSGYATKAIQEIKSKLEIKEMKAEVHIKNQASERLFFKEGFKFDSLKGDFKILVYKADS